MVSKSHQRIIRERIAVEPSDDLFSMPAPSNLRESQVKPISYDTAKTIILKYEWLGTMPPCVLKCFGIYFDGICGGAIVLSEPTHKNVVKAKTIPRDALYLSRGACAYWTPKNSASHLISTALKTLGDVIVFAYNDPRAGEIGQIYQALNWDYLGPSSGGTHAFTVGGKEISTRWLRRKYGTCAREFVESLYPDAAVVPSPRKGRYVGVYGNARYRKYWARRFKEFSKPYPKR